MIPGRLTAAREFCRKAQMNLFTASHDRGPDGDATTVEANDERHRSPRITEE
jgi:hypothetical protein